MKNCDSQAIPGWTFRISKKQVFQIYLELGERGLVEMECCLLKHINILLKYVDGRTNDLCAKQGMRFAGFCVKEI